MCHISGLAESNMDTAHLVIDLAVNKLNVQLKKSEIDRCHCLGTLISDAKTPRSIVVMFNHYDKRRDIYEARSNLKDTGVYINDHLTPSRAHMHTARKYKGYIHNA